jgi:transcription termination/antitermination protein NusA
MSNSPTDDSSVALFMRATGATEEEATALVREGFNTVGEIAYVPHWELESVSELSSDRRNLIRQRAREFVLNDPFDE